MTRVFLMLLGLLFVATPVAGQEPVLKVEIDKTQTIPGQSLSLRLTVLAPTFMLEPPVWPDFDAPNLRVQTVSTGPAFGRVDGDDWTGVTRRYLVTPMVAGDISLPTPALTVTWADPGTSKPLKAALPIQAISIKGVIPAEASGLNPFIAARSIELSQDIKGNPEAMVAGDSITRILHAKIEGTSPIFLPELLSAATGEGLRSYPEDPVFDETNDRGVIGGSRSEQITYVAEGGGTGELPEAAVHWYDLDTGKIETTRAEGVSYHVDGPPVSHAEPRDWRMIILVTTVALAGLLFLLWLSRRLFARVHVWRDNYRIKRLASEGWAWKEMRAVIRARDFAHLNAALNRWAARLANPSARHDPRLIKALTRIGAARYGQSDQSEDKNGWRELEQLLPEIRNSGRKRQAQSALPSLNPGSSQTYKKIET